MKDAHASQSESAQKGIMEYRAMKYHRFVTHPPPQGISPADQTLLDLGAAADFQRHIGWISLDQADRQALTPLCHKIVEEARERAHPFNNTRVDVAALASGTIHKAGFFSRMMAPWIVCCRIAP